VSRIASISPSSVGSGKKPPISPFSRNMGVS
jgi:hypothetical protein